LRPDNFYEEEPMAGGWSKRQLERKIHSLFYECFLAIKDKRRMPIHRKKHKDIQIMNKDNQVEMWCIWRVWKKQRPWILKSKDGPSF